MKTVPRSVENWLYQCILQGMMREHQEIPFDDLSEALSCKEDDIVPEWIRATLDLANEGRLDEEAPDTATLTEIFGPYSHIAKGFRTLGGPNELFGTVAYILS